MRWLLTNLVLSQSLGIHGDFDICGRFQLLRHTICIVIFSILFQLNFLVAFSYGTVIELHNSHFIKTTL